MIFVPAATNVCAEIERRILNGAICGGARVKENAIATEFGVSRAAVREAVRALERAGLVRIEANRGAIVRDLELSEVVNIYDMWAGISRAAGRLAAMRANLPQINEINRLHEQMLKVRDQEDAKRYHLLNIEFHARIFDCAGNTRLRQMHDQISKEMMLFSKRGVIGVGSLRVSAREHTAILEGIKTGDSELAASSFENHVLNGKQRIIESVVNNASSARQYGIINLR